jgi:Xaa-Pro dipeptidase
MSDARLSKLSASLRSSGLDALALNPGPSLAYLTGLGFHLMERPVVALFTADSAPVIVLPGMEARKLDGLPFEVRAFTYGEDPAGWEAVFREAVSGLNLDGKRIGVEPLRMRLMEFRHLRAAALRADFPDGSEAVGRLRVRKEPEEVGAVREAVRIAQEALEATLSHFRVGVTERELAGELVVQLLRHGSQPEMPFSPIVSAGPNGANPHAEPSDRPILPGDLLVVDWGATCGGYVSDLTRTFAVGVVDPEFERIHRTVQEANAAGRAAARPGAPCAEVDRAARGVIENAGCGEYFTHRTGHGIGLEPHEVPYIRGDNLELMQPGMVFTVEPGIYLPGRSGVRIEDNLVVTEDGADCLSGMPRELRVIG